MQYLERTSATSLIEVHLEQADLDVSFSADNRRVKEGQRVEFERRIGGGFAPYSYEWDFGDGSTSTSEYPVHTYKTAGSYTVSLKVTDDRGNTDIRTRDDYIDVLPGWSAGSIVRSAWNGLIVFGQVVADILIWFGIFSPVWIIAGGILYWFWWRKRQKKA
jgi:PKD repeat protein